MSAAATSICSPARSSCSSIATRESRVAPAAVHRLRQLLVRQVGDSHRHAHLAAELRRQRTSLCASLQRERRRVEFVLHEGAASRSKVRRRPPAPWRIASHSDSGSTPALTPIVKHLGQRRLDRVAGAVVHQLGHRAGADRADVLHLVAHRVQHVLDVVEHVLVAADPDRQLAAVGARRARRSPACRARGCPSRRTACAGDASASASWSRGRTRPSPASGPPAGRSRPAPPPPLPADPAAT